MAAYRKLPSGKHNFLVRLPDGSRKSFTDPMKSVARRRAEDFEAAIRRGESPAERGRGTTVGQWHARWSAARNVGPRTAHEEKLRWDRYVEPEWSSWPLRAIGRIDVQAWVTKLGKERGPHVAFGCYILLSKMLADAELEGLIPATPCKRIDLPKIERPAPRWLTREEYDRLLLAFDHPDARQPEQWRAYVAVACNTGLRSGELAGLDVRHVDFDRQLVSVEQVMTKFGLRGYPKSESSRRTVHCPPEALELLWPTVADRDPASPCFPAPRGGRLDQSNFLKTVWHPALRRAGIEPVRAYVTRHSFASWMVQAGVPLWDIAQALGHNSLQFVNRYAFLQPDAHDSIRAAFARQRDAQMTHEAPAMTPPNPRPAGQSTRKR